MTTGEILFLVLVLGAFVVFTAVLAYASWSQRPRD